jgi:hypothetical protein
MKSVVDFKDSLGDFPEIEQGQFPVAPLGKMFIPITAAEAI